MGKSKEKFMDIHEHEHIRDKIILEAEEELNLLWFLEESERLKDESNFRDKSEYQDLPF